MVWNQADRAVLFKPPGWEVYGAHTALQLSSFAALRFGNSVGRLHHLEDHTTAFAFGSQTIPSSENEPAAARDSKALGKGVLLLNARDAGHYSKLHVARKWYLALKWP